MSGIQHSGMKRHELSPPCFYTHHLDTQAIGSPLPIFGLINGYGLVFLLSLQRSVANGHVLLASAGRLDLVQDLSGQNNLSDIVFP